MGDNLILKYFGFANFIEMHAMPANSNADKDAD